MLNQSFFDWLCNQKSKLVCEFFVCILYKYFLQGKLCGFGVEEQLPTVAIVAHYDAYGIAPVSFIF